ncbi:MAG: glycosyltransferase [Bryobacterales bacterium]|nr:glycosyltransferase [Bryobacterales bacterium]
MRLAFFSPFNPLKTGVADYSEELLPHLSAHAEVDLVTGGYTLANKEIRDRYRILSPEEFLASAGRYDMAVYQLANNVEQHGYMAPCMKRAPGIAVLHDYYLHYLMLGLTLLKGDIRTLRRIFAARYGGSGSALAHRVLFGMFDPYQVSTVLPLVEMSRGVIMHNAFGESLVSADAGGRPVRVIPMGIPIRPLLDQAALKRKYGYEPDDFVLASVSTLSHTKRTKAILPALKRLWRKHPRLHFLILGGGKLPRETRHEIEVLNDRGRIRMPGWLAAEEYWECLNLADAAIDLRYPSGAETSASLLRAMSAGKPLIVSRQGSFLELPDECAWKTPVDNTEESTLCEYLTAMLECPPLVSRMGAAARRQAETSHRLELAADAYLRFIREVADSAVRAPSEDWFDAPPSRLSGAAYATLYKASRAVALLRNYGIGETLRRIRTAPEQAGAPGTADEARFRGVA